MRTLLIIRANLRLKIPPNRLISKNWRKLPSKWLPSKNQSPRVITILERAVSAMEWDLEMTAIRGISLMCRADQKETSFLNRNRLKDKDKEGKQKFKPGTRITIEPTSRLVNIQIAKLFKKEEKAACNTQAKNSKCSRKIPTSMKSLFKSRRILNLSTNES
jgi:hypothetical protein